MISEYLADPSHHCLSCPGPQTLILQNLLNSKLSKYIEDFSQSVQEIPESFGGGTFVVLIYSTYKYEEKKIGRHKKPTHNA